MSDDNDLLPVTPPSDARSAVHGFLADMGATFHGDLWSWSADGSHRHRRPSAWAPRGWEAPSPGAKTAARKAKRAQKLARRRQRGKR